MEFWARRPLHVNLTGILLLLVLWFGLGWIASRLSAGADLPLWWPQSLPLFGSLLVATLVVTRFFDRMPATWTGIGFHRGWGRELLLGTGLGCVMAVLAWTPAALSGEVHQGGLGDLGYFLLPMFVNAAGEELLFRGYIFQRGAELLGPVAATLLASILFGLMHAGNPNVTPLGIAVIMLGGIFFALCYLRTGSLWLPIGAHAAWNILLAKVLGLPVSGKEFGDSLLRTTSHGSEIITGGSFGPEGGIAGIIALIIGIILLVRLPVFVYSPYVHAEVFRRFYAIRKELREKKALPR